MNPLSHIETLYLSIFFEQPAAFADKMFSAKTEAFKFKLVTRTDDKLILPYEKKPFFNVPQKAVVWSPSNFEQSLSVMMTNMSDGSHSWVWNYARSSLSETIYIAVDINEKPFQTCRLEYYSDMCKIFREVAAVYSEGGWYFCQNGPVQVFERPENYNLKRTKDRFNPAILFAYLNSIGIKIQDDAFWKPLGKVYYLEPETANGAVVLNKTDNDQSSMKLLKT